MQFVLQAQLGPFRFAQLMKREHVNALNVSYGMRKAGEALDVVRDIGPAGDKHVT